MPHQCFNSHSKLQKHRNLSRNGFQRSFCYCSVLALHVRHTVLLEHRSLVEVRKKTNLLSPTLQETGSFCVPCLTLFGVVNVVNFLLQLWPQHGWSLWVGLDLGSSDIAAGCCLQNVNLFSEELGREISFVCIFTGECCGGLELDLTLEGAWRKRVICSN